MDASITRLVRNSLGIGGTALRMVGFTCQYSASFGHGSPEGAARTKQPGDLVLICFDEVDQIAGQRPDNILEFANQISPAWVVVGNAGSPDDENIDVTVRSCFSASERTEEGHVDGYRFQVVSEALTSPIAVERSIASSSRKRAPRFSRARRNRAEGGASRLWTSPNWTSLGRTGEACAELMPARLAMVRRLISAVVRVIRHGSHSTNSAKKSAG